MKSPIRTKRLPKKGERFFVLINLLFLVKNQKKLIFWILADIFLIFLLQIR